MTLGTLPRWQSLLSSVYFYSVRDVIARAFSSAHVYLTVTRRVRSQTPPIPITAVMNVIFRLETG